MDLHELKRILQDRFTDGLLTIIGSGLSASMGLPTMWALGEYLRKHMPGRVSDEAAAEWAVVESRLASGTDLEGAVKDIEANGSVLPEVVALTAELVAAAESEAIQSVLANERDFALRRLLRHLLLRGRSDVVTTNYDRLIEFAAETSGIGVDTGFTGSCFGNFAPEQTRNAFSAFVGGKKGTIKRIVREHLVVHKPHGSIDWYLLDNKPVRSIIPLRSGRLMITPGTSKYRLGYEAPFDYHRATANRAIDSAAAYLIIGYGFNDDQLETHLRPQLATGKPCLILTKELTPSAQQVVSQHPSVLALTSYEEKDGQSGTQCEWKSNVTRYAHHRLWNLSDFLREVLE